MVLISFFPQDPPSQDLQHMVLLCTEYRRAREKGSPRRSHRMAGSPGLSLNLPPKVCLLIIGLTIQGPNPALCVVGKNSWIVTPLTEPTAGAGLRLRGTSQQTQPLAPLINHRRPGDSEFLAVPGRPREGPLLERKFC